MASTHPPVRAYKGRDGLYLHLEDVLAFLDWCSERADPISALGVEKALKALSFLAPTDELSELLGVVDGKDAL